MPSIVEIEGLNIKFPYEPYEIQKNLMSCVVKCIQNREHGLLESPTGTGKTASLLCASLAWQQSEKTRVRQALLLQQNPPPPATFTTTKFLQATKQLHNNNGKSQPQQQQQQLDNDDQIGFSIKSTVPRIIYATRTHSQITQAVRELKRTHYNNVKSVTLGSRDIMCIHDEVSRLPESSTKIMACHMKVTGRSCAYYNNVQKVREQFSNMTMSLVVAPGESSHHHQVMDIEEMVKKGRTQRFCPFFMSKELVADADLIFMPYNYLLDPKLRASHGVDLKGCIVILDEAHNITKVCEDSSSFDLKSSIIAQCLREITKALNEFNNNTSEEISKSGPAKDLTLGEIVMLKAAILELEKNLDSAPFSLDIPADSGKTVPGQDVLRCFFSAGFTIDQFGRFIRVLDGVSSFLAQNLTTEASGCDKFSGVLRVLSTRLLAGNPDLFLSSYTVKVELETTNTTTTRQCGGGGGGGILAPSFTKQPKGKILHFWCLNPAVGLDLLLQHVPRCIMLASGTLSPIDFLETELQLHFPIKIQNPHIITASQLYAAVLKVGPGDVKLSSAYTNRSRPEYLISLATTITQTCLIVPEGVLVFFPSYSAMDQAVDFWKDSGHWQSIAGQKSTYVEPRGKRALDDLISNYYTDTQKPPGSCLMAVCRGKVSEGLDFTDGKCRAVIITGLPYAPYKNEQVTSKINYLDGKLTQKQQNSQQGIIRGNHWYNIDAVRALNQAVGRIIRHRNDFGAILLCDDRCDYKDVNQNLSTWVSKMLIRPSFSELKEGLSKFFRSYGIVLNSSSNTGFSSSSERPPNRIIGGSGSSSSGFQFNSHHHHGSKVLRNGNNSSSAIIKIDYDQQPPDDDEPEFSKLYYEQQFESSQRLLLSGSSSSSSVNNKPKLDFESLQATTSPTVSFASFNNKSPGQSSSSSLLAAAMKRKSEKSLKNNGSTPTTFAASLPSSSNHPKKKIKLVAGSNYESGRYSRIIVDNNNPSWLLSGGGGGGGRRKDMDSFPSAGITTAHHFKRKDEQEEGERKYPIFSKGQGQQQQQKPFPNNSSSSSISSTASSVKPSSSSTCSSPVSACRTFKNVKDFGAWIKGKLASPEKFRKVMSEFKDYKEKKEILTLLNFGKEIFPDNNNAVDYISFINGLKLVSTAADRGVIDDVMSAYEDLETTTTSDF